MTILQQVIAGVCTAAALALLGALVASVRAVWRAVHVVEGLLIALRSHETRLRALERAHGHPSLLDGRNIRP